MGFAARRHRTSDWTSVATVDTVNRCLKPSRYGELRNRDGACKATNGCPLTKNFRQTPLKTTEFITSPRKSIQKSSFHSVSMKINCQTSIFSLGKKFFFLSFPPRRAFTKPNLTKSYAQRQPRPQHTNIATFCNENNSQIVFNNNQNFFIKSERSQSLFLRNFFNAMIGLAGQCSENTIYGDKAQSAEQM